MKRFWLTVFFFIIGSAILIFGFRQKSLHTAIPAAQGVLDLGNEDVSTGNFLLDGQWEFYWAQLLNPNDLPAFSPSYINVPSLWNDIELNGKTLTSQGYATYKLKLILPQDRPKMGLTVYDVYSSYKFYINKKLVLQNGNPAIRKEDAVPFWNTKTIMLPSGIDTLDLEMQVANFWHSKGGVYKAPLLCNYQQLIQENAIDWGLNVLLTGCLFMSGLLFFGLYLFAKHDKSILYFSIFCIVYCYRIIGTEPYILHGLFPGISWFISIRLEYISLALSVAFFIMYMRYLYPEEANSTLVKILFWICVIYTVIIVIAPVQLFSAILPIYLAAMFFYIVYAFYIFALASRHNRSGSDYAFLSSGVALILFFIINLHYFGIISPVKEAITVGYILFLFLQSLILSFRFSYTLKQAALLAEQGLKSKSEFLSTMSHEIRTPLNAVIGMTHLLRNSEPREDQKENLEVLSFSANNLMYIVNDILDFSKLEANQMKFEAIDMHMQEIGENIIGAQQSFATEKGLQLKYEFDELIPYTVNGDPTRLTQVISNLLHNAIKFTRTGWVKLSITKEAEDENNVTIKILVEDTGIGISAEQQKMIFERFTQADSSISRSFGGTGLGLAICKKILELQNVQLEIKSEPGNGSIFWFVQTFPIVERSRKIDTVAATVDLLGKPLQHYNILLVEDNSFNAMVAKSILGDFGATIEHVVNGKEAIEKFDPGVHHLILMDLSMPVMDGYEATEKIREKNKTTPIIALTATVPADEELQRRGAIFSDVIGKPFNPDVLCRAILKQLGAMQ
ncbi:MAG: ATP-binding protein [Agriterribacter sp.]